MGEAIAAGIGIATLAGIAGVVAAVWVWANAVARKHAGRAYQIAKWYPRAAGALLLAGFVIASIGLVRVFNSVANAEAASKATMLALGISEALNLAALPAALALPLLCLSVVTSSVGTLRTPR